jgi:aminopeptidase-like protein
MANNELSGPLALAFLYKELKALPEREYSYRFVLAPETIGVIAFLDRFGGQLKDDLIAGYVMTCCGDSGPFTFKRSKREKDLCNRAAEHILRHHYPDHDVIDFAVGGSDERQYCSPGFNFPVGSLMRTPYQRYPEYHTSLDDRSLLSFSALEETVVAYKKIVQVLEMNGPWQCTVPYCEPQLGKRGLYPSSVSPDAQREKLHDLLHFISYADGEHDLISVAEKRNKSALDLEQHLRACKEKGLI